MLALQAAVTGVFLAESLILFYVAWECVLVPMFFLIGGWGSSNRKHAATKFLIYTFAAGGVMLLGVIVTLIMSEGGTSISQIARDSAAITAPTLVFWLFMVGFLVKIPAVPVHTWLPDAHTEAPTAGSIVLAGVMLKMGGYGVLRIAMPFAPSAFDAARGSLAILGVVGIVYGAAMALVQTDLKRLVAYSSVAHMGFVILAIAAATRGVARCGDARDGQPWLRGRTSLPAGGLALRPCAYPGARSLRRSRQSHADMERRLRVRFAGFAGTARPLGLPRRVRDRA